MVLGPPGGPQNGTVFCSAVDDFCVAPSSKIWPTVMDFVKDSVKDSVRDCVKDCWKDRWKDFGRIPGRSL